MKLFGCITEHNEAQKTMTHTFKKGVRVIVNWRLLTVTIERYQRTLDVFQIDDFYTVDAHERLLREVERITSRTVLSLFRETTDKELKLIRERLPRFLLN